MNAPLVEQSESANSANEKYVSVQSGHGISQSQSIQEISKALFSVQSQMMAVAKDADNSFYRAKYATLHAVWQTLQPLMKDAGLVVMQSSGDARPIVIQGKASEQVVLFMDFFTRITHSETGEWIQSVSEFPLGKIDPQGYGSAMTYARRYCLSALMGIVVDDDDDGNAGSGKQQPPQNQNQNGSRPAQQGQQSQRQQQPPNQQQRQQPPTGQQAPPNQAPPNQPPAGQQTGQPTALQRLGTFLKQAGCQGSEDASLLIDFIAPSQNWETVQNEEIALFVINLVNEGITAGRFVTSTVLQTARAAQDAAASFN